MAYAIADSFDNEVRYFTQKQFNEALDRYSIDDESTLEDEEWRTEFMDELLMQDTIEGLYETLCEYGLADSIWLIDDVKELQ